MGGSISSGWNNDELIDNLVKYDYVRSPHLQKVFRAVDRGDYYFNEDNDSAHGANSPYYDGTTHLSSPFIYGEIMEALTLKKGHSFLNLGSGSGYLSTMVGLILGRYGVNHGIEISEKVVDFANHRLREFLLHSDAIDVYEFCEPKFMVGNCFNLDSINMQLYDRVYCGAACPEEYEPYMKSLIKIGGVLVMPLEDRLVARVTRTGESSWSDFKVMSVPVAPLRCPKGSFDFLKLPDISPPSLKEICRSKVRTALRQIIDVEHPQLKNKDSLSGKLKSRSRTVRRIVIPINDESEPASDSSQNNSDSCVDKDANVNSLLYKFSTSALPVANESDSDVDKDANVDSLPFKYSTSALSVANVSDSDVDEDANVDNLSKYYTSALPVSVASILDSDVDEDTNADSLPTFQDAKTNDSGIPISGTMATDDETLMSSFSGDEKSIPFADFSYDNQEFDSKELLFGTRRVSLKRQHSDSKQQCSAKNCKRSASKSWQISILSDIFWKRTPSESDFDEETKTNASDNCETSEEPNYSALMSEKIKSLPLPNPLLRYLNYERI